MADFLHDTFTDVSTTLLTSHTGELGATWTILDSPDVARISAVGSVYLDTGTPGDDAFYLASGTPAGAEYDITVAVVFQTQIGGFLISGRTNADASDRYSLLWVGGTWTIYETVANSSTAIAGPYTPSYSADQVITVKLEIRNASKKAYFDTVLQLTDTTHNNVTAVGKVGMYFLEGSDTTNGMLPTEITGTDAVTGRTTKNTRSWGLGMELGMGLWLPR